jgi:hypothetical protein
LHAQKVACKFRVVNALKQARKLKLVLLPIRVLNPKELGAAQGALLDPNTVTNTANAISRAPTGRL